MLPETPRYDETKIDVSIFPRSSEEGPRKVFEARYDLLILQAAEISA